MGWDDNPASMTPANVRAAQPYLPRAMFLQKYAEATEMQRSPVKIRSVSIDNDQVDATLINNHLGFLLNPKETDPNAQNYRQQMVLLKAAIRDRFDTVQQQTGSELDYKGKQAIIDHVIGSSKHLGDPNSNDGIKGGDQFTALMSPQQVKDSYNIVQTQTGGTASVNTAFMPDAVRVKTISKLQKAGLPVTEQSIATKWNDDGRPLK